MKYHYDNVEILYIGIVSVNVVLSHFLTWLLNNFSKVKKENCKEIEPKQGKLQTLRRFITIVKVNCICCLCSTTSIHKCSDVFFVEFLCLAVTNTYIFLTLQFLVLYLLHVTFYYCQGYKYTICSTIMYILLSLNLF